MASDKASPHDPEDQVGDTAETAERSAPRSGENGANDVSDDLDRIASYLTDTRSATSDRTKGLADGIAHRRADVTARSPALAGQLNEVTKQGPAGQIATRTPPRPLVPGPLFAERFHVFCCDLDQMLESFRARIESKNQIRH